MGKETKIGLGIIGVLGVVFAVVLVQRLIGSKNAEVASEATRPDYSMRASGDPPWPLRARPRSESGRILLTPRGGPFTMNDCAIRGPTWLWVARARVLCTHDRESHRHHGPSANAYQSA